MWKHMPGSRGTFFEARVGKCGIDGSWWNRRPNPWPTNSRTMLKWYLSASSTTASPISETVEPRAENRGIYDELYRIYRELYPATREASHSLADLQKGGGDVVT